VEYKAVKEQQVVKVLQAQVVKVPQEHKVLPAYKDHKDHKVQDLKDRLVFKALQAALEHKVYRVLKDLPVPRAVQAFAEQLDFRDVTAQTEQLDQLAHKVLAVHKAPTVQPDFKDVMAKMELMEHKVAKDLVALKVQVASAGSRAVMEHKEFPDQVALVE
jgi:hypothetical protein